MDEIKLGEGITWTHITKRGKSLSMSLRCGIVEAIDGEMVTVIRSGGKRETVELKRLRRPGQKSEIAEFVEVLRANQ